MGVTSNSIVLVLFNLANTVCDGHCDLLFLPLLFLLPAAAVSAASAQSAATGQSFHSAAGSGEIELSVLSLFIEIDLFPKCIISVCSLQRVCRYVQQDCQRSADGDSG